MSPGIATLLRFIDSADFFLLQTSDTFLKKMNSGIHTIKNWLQHKLSPRIAEEGRLIQLSISLGLSATRSIRINWSILEELHRGTSPYGILCFEDQLFYCTHLARSIGGTLLGNRHSSKETSLFFQRLGYSMEDGLGPSEPLLRDSRENLFPHPFWLSLEHPLPLQPEFKRNAPEVEQWIPLVFASSNNGTLPNGQRLPRWWSKTVVIAGDPVNISDFKDGMVSGDPKLLDLLVHWREMARKFSGCSE